MATKYYFRDDRAPFGIANRDKADAQVIGVELARIKKTYGDAQPDRVWKQAQHPNNPLHPHYEWDERKAAESHWRATSRELIGSIEITSTRQRERTQMMISLTQPTGRRYFESIEILDNRHLQLALWEDAKNELTAFLKRFARLRKLCKAAARGGKVIDAEIAKLKASIVRGP